MKRHRFSAKLKDSYHITPTVKHFIFEVPEDFDYHAGQFMSNMFIAADGSMTGRAYSIASAPHQQGIIEFSIKLVENGLGSNYMFQLKPGDELKMKGPQGKFFLTDEQKSRNLVFIATGTGLSPFRGIIKDLLYNNHRDSLILLTGVRYEDEVLYYEELCQLAEANDNFQYYSTVSRSRNETYRGRKGRVQNLLQDVIPLAFEGKYFLCGLSLMIEETTELLKNRGVDETNIHFEKYD